MINLDNHSVRWWKNGKYHKGFTIRVTVYPSLLIPWIFEQFKKGLSYRNAITMEQPYWSGDKWKEGKDLDDIPF